MATATVGQSAQFTSSSSSSSSSRFIDLIRSSDKVHIGMLSKAKASNPSHCYPSIIWLVFSFIIKRDKFYLYSTLFTSNTGNKIVVCQNQKNIKFKIQNL